MTTPVLRSRSGLTVVIAAVVIAALVVLLLTRPVVDAPWISALASVGTLAAAWFAAVVGVRSLRQVQTDSDNRSRPMVGAELRPVAYVQGSRPS